MPIMITLTEDQKATLNNTASALIAGLKVAAPAFNIAANTFFKLSAGTSIAATMAESIDTGQYTLALLKGSFGAFAAFGAVELVAVATLPVAVGVAIVAAASYGATVLAGYVYASGVTPNIDVAALDKKWDAVRIK